MKHVSLFLLLLLPTAIVLSCSHGNKRNDEQIFKVHTYSVIADSSSKSMSFPGRVKATEEFNLSFKVSGRIQNIYVKEGDFVKKGSLVAQIDPKDYQTIYDAANAKFNQVSSEAGRVIRLYQDSVVSTNDYDKARYGLQQAKATLELSKRQIDDCKLYAPKDGYIQKIFFESSSIIGSGLPILTMISSGVPVIEIDIPASVYLGISKFDHCTAKFANNVIDPLELKVRNTQPKANANQLYTVTLNIVAKDCVMPKPGMTAMVDIHYKGSQNSDFDTTIPSGALFNRNDSTFIWVIGSDGCVASRHVSVNSLDADGMAVLDEILPTGTVVVTAGVHKLHEGQKVEEMEKPSKTNVGGIL